MIKIKKTKLCRLIFLALLTFTVIFNGGYSDLSIQFNFLGISTLFFFLLIEKNYLAHFQVIFKKNKLAIYLFLIFLIFLIFQILPMPIELIKLLSPMKYDILNSLEFDSNYTSISLDPSNSFFNFLNYFSLFLYLIIFKSIFYKNSHIINFYYYLTLLGAVTSSIAVYFYLIGNPSFLFIDNLAYKSSATGFFINRTVFSCFLVLSLFCGIEYLKNSKIYSKNDINSFFKKIYLRIFILLITIGIITSFSRLGNFLFISLMIIYVIQSLYFSNKKNKIFLYTLLFIVLFDVLLLGYYFGLEKLLTRYSFLIADISGYMGISTESNLSRAKFSYFALSEFKNFLFFGYGAGAFEYLFNLRYEDLSYHYTIHSHSDLSEFLGELGLIGFSLISLSIFYLFIKNNTLNFKNLLLIYLLFFILIFDFSFHVPIIQLMFIILLSINLNNNKIINKF
jgi:hypothetical protein